MKFVTALLILFLTWTALATAQDGVYRLNGISPDLPSSDLRPLDSIIGGARVVAFGEPVHGSGGLSKFKFRLIKHAVQDLGFRAVGIEANWMSASKVSEYVKSGSGSPEQVIYGLRDFLRDPSTLEMLKWLRQFNVDHPDDPVVLFGYDIQDPYAQYGFLKEFFKSAEPSSSEALINKIETCLAVHAESEQGLQYDLEWQDAFTYGLEPERYRTCKAGIHDLLKYINANRSAIEQKIPSEKVKFAELALTNLDYWEEFYWVKKGYPRSDVRDLGIFNVVQSLESFLFPGKKIVLSGHNVHVGAAMGRASGGYVDKVWAGATHTLGMNLNRAYGAKYVPVGIAVSKAETQYYGPAPKFPVANSPESIEVMLHNLGHPHLLLDTNGGFIKPCEEYLMSQQDSVIKLNLHDNYRAILYLEHAGAVE